MSSETVYTGVVGPEMLDIDAVMSVLNMHRREGDDTPRYIKATKGYEARQKHINNFLATEYDYILLLDGDMIFEPDTLDKLRDHNLPYVSGLYLRRTVRPIYPVWYHPFETWPYHPWVTDPERGKLHAIGASGWGCVLIHRSVIMAVREMLKGEWEVLEDDMDVWPYDLEAVLKGDEQIKVLRGEKDIVGSDIRFPFYALQCGYQLWGDPDVRPAHLVNYPLTPDDLSNSDPSVAEEHHKHTTELVKERRATWQAHIKRLESIKQDGRNVTYNLYVNSDNPEKAISEFRHMKALWGAS